MRETASRPCRRATSVRRAAALLLALALGVSACGGGGGGGGGGGPSFGISTSTLPVGGVDVPYSPTLQVTGGTSPYVWTLALGSSLPPGLGLSSTGTISGTPTTLGTFTFGVSVRDSASTPRTDGAT